jgi:DNA invertase Pin-like site-specific DNA recombinase
MFTESPEVEATPLDEHQFARRHIRFESCLARGVALFIRQSTQHQKHHNLGSAEVQRRQLDFLVPYGISSANVRLYDALGESGRAGADRAVFNRLLDDVRAGLIGLLVLGRHDRMARNDVDSAALIAALVKSKSMLLIGGRLFDPSDPHDKFILGIHAQMAEYENAIRLFWMQSSRLRQIERRAYCYQLPSGLVWASPDDDAYADRLRAENMAEWLAPFEDGTRKGYHTQVIHNGTILYPLPFPDRRVILSVELRMRWLLESGSLAHVARCIHSHPEWPSEHLGQVPVTTGTRWSTDMQVCWHRVHRNALRVWFLSPALYGIYSASSKLVGQDAAGISGPAASATPH